MGERWRRPPAGAMSKNGPQRPPPAPPPLARRGAPAFAALNADPEVTRHFAAPLSRAESDAMLARARAHEARTASPSGPPNTATGDARSACAARNTSPSTPASPRRSRSAGACSPPSGAGAWRGGGGVRAPSRLRPARAGRSRSLHRPGEQTVLGVDATARDAAGRQLRPPPPAGGPSPRPHLLYRVRRAEWRGGASGPEH